MQDLFIDTPRKTDIDRLYDWMLTLNPGRFKTSDVIKWGTENYSNRADRNKRVLVEQGKIWHLKKSLKELWFKDVAEEVYTIYEWEGEKYGETIN